MSGWSGKILGAALGALAGGPVGAVVGALVGHQFDRGLAEGTINIGQASADVQRLFFNATFGVMGHIAKADGRVSEDEIRAARAVMHHMRLGGEQVQEAIRLFTEGKKADYPVERVVAELNAAIGRRAGLARAFIEIQVHAMVSAGQVSAEARHVLWRVASALGVSRVELAQVEALIRLQQARSEGARRAAGVTVTPLAEAYRTLGLEPKAGDREVKTAYRRLMNQHHPDKLRARGLPDSMIPAAEERTREIRAAYERIKEVRRLK